jgi:hypothetical protein
MESPTQPDTARVVRRADNRVMCGEAKRPGLCAPACSCFEYKVKEPRSFTLCLESRGCTIA